ncbi:MAG: OmpA family protein [Bacteroidales bacterium]|nr:OmpA family protein [Bacteroidales bacterium]
MKTKIINNSMLLLILICLNLGVFAQRSLQKARELKNNFDYAEALVYYNNYFRTNTPTVDHAREVSESYFKINDTRNAELWLSKVISSGSFNASDVLNYAHLLRSNGKYNEAIIQYEKYAELNPSDRIVATQWITASEMALIWMQEITYFKVVNAEVFNSENADFGLIPFGEEYILTSDRETRGSSFSNNDLYGWTGKPYLKLMLFSDVDLDDNTAEINVLNSINNEFHNGPANFDVNRNTVFFTRTKAVRVRKSPVNSDPTSWIDYAPQGEFISRLEIYSSDYSNGTWTEPKPFAYNKAEEYSVGHPALAPDGSIMYFASDMPGGFGGTDLYYSILNIDGTWSIPQNAGESVNTSGNEVFPYVEKNGTLYFSSNGHPGMGGLDIFKAFGSQNRWTSPENLKFPFNSPKDDFSIIFTEIDKSGFIASNRDGGRGDDDIYRFELLPPRNMTVVVITKERIDNSTSGLLPQVNLNVVTGDNTSLNLNTDENGLLYMQSDCNESYNFTAIKDGYFSDNKSITTECRSYNDTLYVELLLNKFVVGRTFAIKNIFYDFDKWDIRDDAKPDLDDIVKILTENPQINIELGSHTDSRGTDRYNERLSQRRAESAVAYIISRGIDQSRITAKGYGESELVNQCADGVRCTDEEHQMNRRTEFKITSLNY